MCALFVYFFFLGYLGKLWVFFFFFFFFLSFVPFFLFRPPLSTPSTPLLGRGLREDGFARIRLMVSYMDQWAWRHGLGWAGLDWA